MNRLNSTLSRLRTEGKKALGLFVTAGFPTLDATAEILIGLGKSGVDFIELGMPFSDPLAEGSTIQRTSELALKNGVNLDFCLEVVSQFRSNSDTPLLLMGYINPVFKYGVSNFCSRASSSGVDGLIIADLPYHESAFLRQEARKHDLDIIHLVTPNTASDRVSAIDEATSGFVYAVSLIGLTGSDLERNSTVDEYLIRLRQTVTKNPVMAGFGIRTAEDANALALHTDGVIVGSAFLNEVAARWSEFATEEEKNAAVVAFVDNVRPTIGTTGTMSR